MHEEYINKGLISREGYDKALALQKQTGVTFHQALIKLNLIQEENVIAYCKKILGR